MKILLQLLKSAFSLLVLTESWPIQTHRAPPQRIGIGSKVFVELVLHEVDEERREDENQEADVPGGHQFLQRAFMGKQELY